MSHIKTIFTNMSWIMISQLVSSAGGFIWTILIARYLGVNDYGVLGFAISFTGLLFITMDFGINSHIVRHVATDYDSASKYLGNAIPLKSIFSIGTFLLATIILILMGCDELTIIITLLFTLESVIKTMCGVMNGVFMAHEEGKYQGIENLIVTFFTLLFIILAVFYDLGLYGITFAYLIANAITLIYVYYALRKNIVKPKFELDLNFCKKITWAAIPFAITGLFYTIYYSIDVVMLTSLIGDYATGIYNATYKLISVLTLFYGIYTAVIYPVMSKFFKNDKKLLLISYEKSIKYLMLVMIPLAVATMFYSLDIIQLIYGHEYDAASSPLSILIWTVSLLFICGAGNTLLNASHKELTVTKIYAIAAAFNIILNFFMIPHFSYNGAAISTVLSDLLILIIQTYVIYKLGYKVNKKLYFDLIKIISGSVILGIALSILNINMWVAIPVGIIIYLLSVTLLKLFDDDDKYIIREIITKK